MYVVGTAGDANHNSYRTRKPTSFGRTAAAVIVAKFCVGYVLQHPRLNRMSAAILAGGLSGTAPERFENARAR